MAIDRIYEKFRVMLGSDNRNPRNGYKMVALIFTKHRSVKTNINTFPTSIKLRNDCILNIFQIKKAVAISKQPAVHVFNLEVCEVTT